MKKNNFNADTRRLHADIRRLKVLSARICVSAKNLGGSANPCSGGFAIICV